MSRFHQRRTAKLKQLAAGRPFVAASLCAVNRWCGKPNCKCAHGQPHRAHVLTFKANNKTRTIHVPKEMVEEVREWVHEYKRIKQVMREISSLSVIIIQRHVRTSRAAARGRRPLQR